MNPELDYDSADPEYARRLAEALSMYADLEVKAWQEACAASSEMV